MRSYSFKSLGSRIITWLMVVGIALSSLQSTALTQAATGSAPNTQASDKRLPQTDTPDVPLTAEANPVGPSLKDAKGTIPIMIELQDDPVVVAQYATQGQGKTKNAQVQIAVAQKSKIESAQANTLNALKNSSVKYTYLYQVVNAYNGIAIQADASSLAELAKLPGLKALHRIPTMERTNAYSQALIKAPVAWGSYGITGTNVKIGIIDTGIDYIHTNFGGRGLQSDYDYAHTVTGPVVVTDSVQLFPSTKVAGGYDFAGDAYTGSNAPVPDQNPLDCSVDLGGGHGSHVAGTAAGYGVNADGTTYTGPYNESTDLEAMRIGPGVAPGATLYALRVFGCTGSTNLTEAAIDWAVDPDGNPATDDHLDVINMSLGASYGSADDTSTAASNNAALAGISVVISAGNDGDVYYVNGSPGSAQRALTVANSGDAEAVTDGFRVTTDTVKIYPASRSAAYAWQTQTGVSVTVPVTAPIYYPTTNQSGCAAWTGADLTNISGTIVLLDWATAPGATTFPCGSVARGANAEAAHAKGIIMVSGVPYLDASIFGATYIPSIYTVSTVGDEIKSQLTPGVVSTLQATLTNEYNNSIKLLFPGQNDTIDASTSRGPQGVGNNLKPDISAPGTTIFSTASGTGDEGESLSGTSMAAPHMTGVMALLHQKFPGWTPEEYKAAAMNTADQDLYRDFNHTGPRYGQARVGAGRVDVATAVADTNRVLAFNADNVGAVSVSFGFVEVTNQVTLTKNIKVVNKSYATASYNISYDGYVDIPGVQYSFPGGSSITVPAHSEITFSVQLTATAALMSHTIDPTAPLLQYNGSFTRNYLSEESGNIILTPTNIVNFNILRVPVYATARPASTLQATGALDFSGSATQTLSVAGNGIFQGSNTPTNTDSLVTPLELAASSPKLNLPSNPPITTTRTSVADLQYIGISSNFTNTVTNPGSRIYFGVSTWAQWTIPHYYEVEFDIFVDTNKDGTDDYVIYNAPLKNGNTFTDLTVLTVLNLHTGGSSTSYFVNGITGSIDTNVFNNNVMVFPVKPSQLGLDDSNASFNYNIYTFDRFGASGSVDSSGPLFYDAARPGLKFDRNLATNPNAYSPTLPFLGDQPGAITTVVIDPASYAANGDQGVLLLHHHNAFGHRAEVVPVMNPQSCGPGDASNVSSGTDDGSGNQCGTLSYALKANNGTQPRTITLSPPANGKVINFTGSTALSVPANVTIIGWDSTPQTGCDQANNIILRNNGGNQFMVLNGGSTLNGITFEGISLQAKTSVAAFGPNKLQCIVLKHPIVT